MFRRAATLMVTGCAVFAVGNAEAVCWIDRVTLAPAGISIFFDKKAQLDGSVKRTATTERMWYTVLGGVVKRMSGAPETLDRLTMSLGQELWLNQTWEDSCTYIVEERETRGHLRIGVVARFNMTLPGLPSREGELFIPAK